MTTWRNKLPRRVLVRGPSMAPTLADGDVVLAALGARATVGAVVLVRWAHRPEQLSIKRTHHREEGGLWWVLGDNPDGSTDSRALGPATVIGVVRCRLWPVRVRSRPRIWLRRT